MEDIGVFGALDLASNYVFREDLRLLPHGIRERVDEAQLALIAHVQDPAVRLRVTQRLELVGAVRAGVSKDFEIEGPQGRASTESIGASKGESMTAQSGFGVLRGSTRAHGSHHRPTGLAADTTRAQNLVSVAPVMVCIEKICVAVLGGVNVAVPTIVVPLNVPLKVSVPR